MRNDTARLAELKGLVVLDSTPETAYDDLTRTVADTFDVPISMVNLLDAERDWFKSCIGLPFSESPADTSFCEVFFGTGDDILVVEDTTKDARFSHHPLVTGAPHIRFYAAARLTSGGHTIGTLCVYDTQVKKVSEQQVDVLAFLARAAMDLLAQRRETPPA